MSVVKVSEAGAARQPSPSIWKDCRNQLLVDLGLGYYFHEEFLGANGSDGLTSGAAGQMAISGDAAYVQAPTLPVDLLGGYQDIETDGDDEDGAAVFAQVMGQIVPNSGSKLWFEARVSLGAATDQGFFVGFAEQDGLDHDIIADEGVAPGNESQFGFSVLSGDTGAVNAMYQLDAGTAVNVLADVTQSTVYTTAGGTAANFPVADAFHKFGMKFDGQNILYYFADGYQVAALTIPAATVFPSSVLVGPILALKNHSGAAVSMSIDWVRAAYQERT